MINSFKIIGSIDRVIQLQNELKQIKEAIHNSGKPKIFNEICELKLQEIDFEHKLILGSPELRLNVRINEASNINNLLKDKSWQLNDDFTKEMVEKYQQTLQNYLIAIEEDRKLLLGYNKPKYCNLSHIMIICMLIIIFPLIILIL